MYGQAAAKMIGVAVSEDLRFPGEAAKCPRMDHPCPVTLKGVRYGWAASGCTRCASRLSASSATPQPGEGQKSRHLLLRAGAADSSLASLTARCPASFAPCSRRRVRRPQAQCGHIPAGSAPIARRHLQAAGLFEQLAQWSCTAGPGPCVAGLAQIGFRQRILAHFEVHPAERIQIGAVLGIKLHGFCTMASASSSFTHDPPACSRGN